MNSLPPLRSVIAFEACYRLRSFTRAAASLNVRQPAISHQIRELEQFLGAKLFERQGARIAATPEADEFYLAASSGLSEIARGADRLKNRHQGDALSLATYPGIAAFWLLPRLAGASGDPDAPPLRVTTAERDADIPLGDADCAILFGNGDWPGFESMLLVAEEVVPVAAPTITDAWTERPAAELLRTAPLIHLEDSEQRWFTWRDWRDRMAPEVTDIASAFTVTNHGVAIQEALLGAGITLGWTGVIADLLERGALVPLYDRAIASDRGYHLVLSRRLEGTSKRAWLLDSLGLGPAH
jgi:LysR family glycine cleavage system transcriptional activator